MLLRRAAFVLLVTVAASVELKKFQPCGDADGDAGGDHPCSTASKNYDELRPSPISSNAKVVEVSRSGDPPKGGVGPAIAGTYHVASSTVEGEDKMFNSLGEEIDRPDVYPTVYKPQKLRGTPPAAPKPAPATTAKPVVKSPTPAPQYTTSDAQNINSMDKGVPFTEAITNQLRFTGVSPTQCANTDFQGALKITLCQTAGLALSPALCVVPSLECTNAVGAGGRRLLAETETIITYTLKIGGATPEEAAKRAKGAATKIANTDPMDFVITLEGILKEIWFHHTEVTLKIESEGFSASGAKKKGPLAAAATGGAGGDGEGGAAATGGAKKEAAKSSSSAAETTSASGELGSKAPAASGAETKKESDGPVAEAAAAEKKPKAVPSEVKKEDGDTAEKKKMSEPPAKKEEEKPAAAAEKKEEEKPAAAAAEKEEKPKEDDKPKEEAAAKKTEGDSKAEAAAPAEDKVQQEKKEGEDKDKVQEKKE